ncbi:TPA: alkylhydroperoxidase [Clostridium botulinum]|uniref:alkylhydroperoxidase n=1 Tax=Clostridium botulinum TaxID=1491 RepID=UPI001FA7A67E|nr:alkylhydroperoxidase [Clostridium botulinum]
MHHTVFIFDCGKYNLMAVSISYILGIRTLDKFNYCGLSKLNSTNISIYPDNFFIIKMQDFR